MLLDISGMCNTCLHLKFTEEVMALTLLIIYPSVILLAMNFGNHHAFCFHEELEAQAVV